jgi:DNA-binding transcriptional LysR family regulator
VLLVLAREHQITGAAKILGVDAATITRRLQSLESALGTTLFHRTGRGLRSTEQLEALLPLFADVETSMRHAFAEAERYQSSAEGLVRLHAGPTLVEHWIIPALAELQRRAPTISLEIDCSPMRVDLQGREADLAVRLTKPRGSGLIARRIASLAMTVAVAPALGRRLGTIEQWPQVPWIGGTGQEERASDEAFVRARAHRYALRVSSLGAQIAAARAGLGAVLTPSLLAERLGLVPLQLSPALQAEVATIEQVPVWMATRQSIRRAARIRLVWDWLMDSASALVRKANGE